MTGHLPLTTFGGARTWRLGLLVFGYLEDSTFARKASATSPAGDSFTLENDTEFGGVGVRLAW